MVVIKEKYNIIMLQPITWLKEILFEKKAEGCCTRLFSLRAITHENGDEMSAAEIIQSPNNISFLTKTRAAPRVRHAGTLRVDHSCFYYVWQRLPETPRMLHQSIRLEQSLVCQM